MTIDQNTNRETDESESLRLIDEDMKTLELKRTKIVRNRDVRSKFDNQVKDWGYNSITEFFIELKYIPDPTVKRPRTKITKETKEKIEVDLKLGTMSTKEISVKYGITEDSVYNIKGKKGLTKQRIKKVSVPSVTVPTESVSPSNVTPMVETTELKKEVV